MTQSKFDTSLILFFFLITVSGIIIAQMETAVGSLGTLETRAILMGIALLSVFLFLKLKSNQAAKSNLFKERFTTVISSTTLGFVAWLLPAIIIISGALLLDWATVEMEISSLDLFFQMLVLMPLMLVAYILPEEWAFRGYIYQMLIKRNSMWASIFIQAVLFTIWGILANGQLDSLIAFFGFGLFLGFLCYQTSTIWMGIGLRLASAVTPALLNAVNFEIVQMEGLLNFSLGILPILVAYFIIIKRNQQNPKAVMNGLKSTQENKKNDMNLKQRGIIYDVGSSYAPGQSSKEQWNVEDVKYDLEVIKESLHCNAVTLMGDDLDRLEEAANHALELGLFIWIHPAYFDSEPDELLSHLKDGAISAEKLRSDHPDKVGLKVGLELSVFTAGSIPGKDFERRVQNLKWLGVLMPWFNIRLNKLLKQTVEVARENFNGSLIYGSGSWENVNWELFDFIGVNYFLDSSTAYNYVEGLRSYQRFNKPIIVTEFGCSAYEGAELKGGEGGWIQDWGDLNNRKLDGKYIRNEQVQSDYIGQLIGIYENEDIYGAFINQFIEEDHPYSDDPLYDLDMASLGIVKACPVDADNKTPEKRWLPKKSFHEIAERYSHYNQD